MQPVAIHHLPGSSLPAPASAPQRLTAPCGLSVEVHQNVTTLAPLVAEWSELAARCPGATFFAGPDWAASWIAHRLAPRRAATLVIVRERGRLVALLPLSMQRLGPLRSASGLCAAAGAYTDFLADDTTVSSRRLLSALWLGIDRLGCDTLTFDAVRDGSVLDALLAMRPGTRGTAHRAVEVSAHLCGSAAAAGSSSLRKDLRRRRRRLAEEMGPIAYRVVQSESEIPHAIEALLALKLAWLDDKGLHARFLAGDETQRWLADTCTRALQAGQLHLSTLSAGGCILAAQLAFQSGKTLCAYIGAFDPAFKRYGAGKLHLEIHLADIAASGLVLDLMPPEDDYKLEWGAPGACVRSSVTPLSARGRALAFVHSPGLRTALKGLYLAMPRGARAKTAATVLAMAAAVRRTLMGLAAPVGEFTPHLSQVAAFA
jgi:CelD/BcsL family acetyltransferase involved in cellulose biosynthesis